MDQKPYIGLWDGPTDIILVYRMWKINVLFLLSSIQQGVTYELRAVSEYLHNGHGHFL